MTILVAVLSVVCLALGYFSVFGKLSALRFRCAWAYVGTQTIAAVVALCERTDFMRLIDAGLICIVMAPVLTAWLIVLKNSNERKKARVNVELLKQLEDSQVLKGKFLAAAKK
ncbi:MAG: hypothetical protein U0103_06365 [Candidatus Obscuribacterales bacterium]